MATSPPSSVEQAGCAALIEFLRTRVCHARSHVIGASARILLEDGAPLDFYVQSINVLGPNGPHIAVNVSEATYSKLHARVSSATASRVSRDTGGPASSFDLVIQPLIRRAYGSRMAPPVCVESSLRRVAPRGVLLLFQPDESAGAFRLRDMLRRSAPSSAGAAGASGSAISASWSSVGASIVRMSAGWLLQGPDAAVPATDATAFRSLFLNPADCSSYRGYVSPADVHAALAALRGLTDAAAAATAASSADGYVVHTERVDAIMDVADLLQHADNPMAAAVLSDILDADMESFAAHEPASYRSMMAALRTLSLCNMSQSSRAGGAGPFHVPVHLPFTAILIALPPDAETSPASAAVVAADAPTRARYQWWDERGRWRASPVSLRHPLVMPSLALMYSVPALVRRHVDGALSLRPTPLRLVPHAAAGSVSARGDASASRRAAASAVPSASEPVEEIPHARSSATFDPCFPHGSSGPFFNRGLAYWHEQRSAWTARPPGYTHPAYPPAFDLDELIEELTDVTNRVELPGPVRLPDMIDMFQEVWSPVDDTDESWSEE